MWKILATILFATTITSASAHIGCTNIDAGTKTKLEAEAECLLKCSGKGKKSVSVSCPHGHDAGNCYCKCCTK